MEKHTIVDPQGHIASNLAEANNNNNMIIDTLNDLIMANRGIINVYKTAVDRLEDKVNAGLIQGYILQQEAFVKELSNAVTSHSGLPQTHADGGSLVKQAWVTLKSVFTTGDGPILAEVSQDSETLLQAYRDAFAIDLPDPVRELIRKQMSEVRVTVKKLSALSAALNM